MTKTSEVIKIAKNGARLGIVWDFTMSFIGGFTLVALFGMGWWSVPLLVLLSVVFAILLMIRSRPPKLAHTSERVCLVIPAYNEEGTIERCIKSALSQSYENKLIVLVDDNSRDGTGEIMRRYSTVNHEVVYLKNDENLGKFQSVLRAFKEVDADIYVIVDADNEFSMDYLEYYVNRMKGIDALETPLSTYNFSEGFVAMLHSLEISMMSLIRMLNFFPNFTGRGMFIRKKVLNFLEENGIVGKDDGAMINSAVALGGFRYRYFLGPALKEFATESFNDFVRQRNRWYSLGMLETYEKGAKFMPIVFGIYTGLVFSVIFLGIISVLLHFGWYFEIFLGFLLEVFIFSAFSGKLTEAAPNWFIAGSSGIAMILVNTFLIIRSFCKIALGKVDRGWYKVSKS